MPRTESSRSPRRTTAAALAVLVTLTAGWAASRSEASGQESALDAHLRTHPGALDDGSLGLLETRVLDVLMPEQAEAWAAGEAPENIVLESGETLSSFIASLLAGGQGLVYVPLDSCLVLRTVSAVAGPMAADETRSFVVRGATTDLSDQGGSAGGCGVPAEAVAVAMHFRVQSMVKGVVGRLFASRTGGPGMPNRAMEYLRQGAEGHAGISIVGLCEGVCAGGDFDLRTPGVPVNARGDVIGFFRPVEPGDLAGLPLVDADTLDGLDSTDFALVSHTHDGGDITSGLVGEPFIDSLITRDDEVVDRLKDGDGSGSGFDADLLDGKHATDFRPRPANVIIVHPGDGDFATIQGALDAIGVDPSYPAASPTNRYLVRVADGVYNEQVTMDPYVDIEGKGKKATVISSPSIAGPMGTVECADDAELRNLTVESTGGDEKAIAIRCAGASPMLTHVRAVATGATGGTPENIGVLNDGVGATPMLTGVHADASTSPGLAVVNQNGAVPTIRDSQLDGVDSAIENRDAAEANVVYTALAGGADFVGPADQSSYHCVRAYVAGTLQQLNAECSPNTPPTAVDDVYASLGNTLLEVTLDHAGAASAANTTATQPSVIGETTSPKTYRSVFENDSDAETADKNLLTAAVVGGTVTAGAVVNMFADGTFEYTPPVGFTGADTFDYTVTDPGGLMDTGTVTVNVSSLIWYVDADNVGTADGRSTTPYSSLAPIDAGGADDGLDGTGDTIFVFDETSGSTADGILLENMQVLHGNGVALDPAGFEYAGGGDLVAAGTAPTLSSAGDVIDLADGNTIRGVDLSVGGALAGITGTSPAGLTIDDVTITAAAPTALGIRLATPTGSFDIDSLTGVGGASGVEINGGSATFDFDAVSSITSSDPGILINGGSTGMTFNGDVSYSAGSNPAIAVEGGHTGTLTFQTGTISATAGTGIGFDNADGTYNFNGTTTLNGGDAGIDILNGSNGTFTFGAGTTISNPSGVAFNLDTSTGGNVTYNGTIAQSNAASAVDINAKTGGMVTFAGNITANTSIANGIDLTANGGSTITFSGVLDIDTTTGTGFNATGGSSAIVQATNAGNTVTTVGQGALGQGVGVNISSGIGALGVTFSSVDVGSSGKANSGILLTNTGSAGTFSVTGGTIQNTTSRGFDAAGADGTVSIGADIQNDGGRSVEISGSEGQFTFDGFIDDDAQGISISSNNTGSPTFTFRGGMDVDTIAGNTGFLAFSGGTLNVCADDNCSAAGGTAVVNTIDVGADIALSVSLVDIGAEGLTFRSISSNGGANVGISLSSTGTAAGNGSLTVTGAGGTCTLAAPTCTGGRIQNKTGPDGSTSQGIGIFLNSTKAPSLSLMRLNDFENFAIRGTNVAGFSLTDSVIDAGAGSFNGDDTAADEGSVSFDNLTGTATFLRSVVSRGLEDNIVVTNSTGTLDMSFTDGTIGLNDSNDGILVESQSSAVLNLTVTDSLFQGSDGDHIQCNAIGSSTMDCTIQDNTFQNAHPSSIGSGITISGGSAASSVTVTYDISGTSPNSQTFRDSVGSAITVNPTNGAGSFTGTIQNNKIGVAGVASSGSSGGGAGIAAGCAGANTLTHTTTINNNDIDGIFGTNGVIDLNTQIACTLNATITSNTINELNGFTLAAIYAITGGANVTDTATLCADVRMNTLDGSASGGFDYFIDQFFGSTSSYRFPGYGGGATPGFSPNALDSFLDGQNTLVQGPPFGIDSSSATNVSGTGVSCP